MSIPKFELNEFDGMDDQELMGVMLGYIIEYENELEELKEQDWSMGEDA